MKFREISHRDKWIQFAVSKPTSKIMPAISWQNHILKGHPESRFVLESDNIEIELLLEEIWPGLSLVEFSQLVDSLKKANLNFNFEVLAKIYNLNFCEKLNRLCQLLPTLPQKWLIWMSNKKLGIRDLEPILLSSTWLKKIEGPLDYIIGLSPGRSEGVRALEMVVELGLMNQELPVNSASFSRNPNQLGDYLEMLTVARYPKRSKQLIDGALKVKSLPWPRKVLAQYQGVGDKTGVEVKFFVQSAQELQRNISGLQDVLTDMNQKNLERL